MNALEQRYSGKVALVAGASKGIGAATARAFAKEGAAVVLLARSKQAIDEVAGSIRERGGEALAIQADVGDERAMKRALDSALERYGRLDAAFNNATDGGMPAPLADLDIEAFDRSMRTNIRGTFIGMRHQIAAMLHNGGGAIANMASVAGVNGTSGLSAYVAGKAGIIGLTKAAALDYADQGIRINVVAPGPILTHHLEAAGAQVQQQAALSTPMRRLGTVEEVAAAVLWLCSEQASYITGAVLPIDGGMTAGTKLSMNYRRDQPPRLAVD
ncbi:glucose 1-dehydrogenase [Ensifer sp. 1H6]|uniref:SDR family NAD(P)-dependent oxidoreductase n=1 Tax=Ensifer sp. 1H6 TaxID=1911585 RepID=UPI0009D34F82|nr:glucose 1-dehydrogenase [Ensifer sp. 1H6]OMQ46658.1 short-chain dehydrogenase [Ensifer sp. 1H6]